MRKLLFLSAIAMTLPIIGSSDALAETFSSNFNNGSMPKQITVTEGDQHELHTKCYRSILSYDPWTVLNLGTNGFAAVSLTHSDPDLKQDNRMTLPDLKIEGSDYVLRWRAVSYHPDFTDSYKVIASVGAKEVKTLFSTPSESATWITHAVSLKEFEGKTVSISFVCDSENGYMLGVDDLYVGPADDVMLFATDSTRRFAGDTGNAPVEGTLFNVGKALSSPKLILLDASGKTVDSKEISGTFNPGDSFSYKLDLPVKLNAKSDYTVSLEADGSRTELCKGIVFASYYPRNLVVEKCTGMWCVNCPEGNILIDDIKATYGDQAIIMENHVSQSGYGDILANDTYWSNLKFYAVPYFMLNRVRDTAFSSTTKFDAGLYKETPVMISVTSVNGLNDEKGSVTTETCFAKELDNSDDRYRVAYSLRADFHIPEMDYDMKQTNGCTLARHERYKYLPNPIMGHLQHYKHVTLTSEYDFAGIPNSLPSHIKVGEKISNTIPVERPELAMSLKDCAIVAYILDTQTGEMLNAVHCLLDSSNSSVGVESVSDEEPASVVVEHGMLSISATPGAVVECYDLTGRVLMHAVADNTGSAVFAAPVGSGVMIVRILAGNTSRSFKTLVH